MKSYDVCIIGSGIAGLAASLLLADTQKISIITKGSMLSGSTPLAQGGIAAVTDFENDSFHSHFTDTMNAGENTNNHDSVQVLVESAPLIMKQLKEWGVEFEPKQHLEGGHSYPRIFHSHDQSGKHIAKILIEKVLQHKNIDIIENSAAFHIAKKENILRYKNFSTSQEFPLAFKNLIIATGGYSSLYAASTSPASNTGDGIAMAMIAGIETKEMDKIQFHPTVLRLKRSPRLLLSEAIRGAGARIVTENKKEIINALLPRNIVAKAVWKSEQNNEAVFLDARMIHNFSEKFPFIAKTLQEEFNLDASKDLLPITFGAHYCMGGIVTDIYGRTNREHIYAIGECANNGVHGNNRLASNSLLEGLVFAKQVSKDILENNQQEKKQYEQIKQTDESEEREENKTLFISSDKKRESLFFETIRNTLSQHASIEKTKTSLTKAKEVFTTMNPLSTREHNAICIANAIIKDGFRNV